SLIVRVAGEIAGQSPVAVMQELAGPVDGRRRCRRQVKRQVQPFVSIASPGQFSDGGEFVCRQPVNGDDAAPVLMPHWPLRLPYRLFCCPCSNGDEEVI